MQFIVFDLALNEITEITPEAPKIVNNLQQPTEEIFYESDDFHQYHEKFCDGVYKVYNIYHKKLYGVYYFGLKENTLRMPYSAPFSIFYLRESQLFIIDNIIKGLKSIATKLKVNSIQITLSPDFYFDRLSEFHIMLQENNFFVHYSDINHFLDLQQFRDIQSYFHYVPYSTRRNIQRGEKANLKFRELPCDEIDKAYEIIALNRTECGYPLKMSLNHVKDVQHIEKTHMRSFVVEDSTGQNYAAAITMDVTDFISQVIYWGDIRKYTQDRPMYKLCVELFLYFKNKGKQILDIGPSSEFGKINSGLSEFKRGLGCRSSLKYTYKCTLM